MLYYDISYKLSTTVGPVYKKQLILHLFILEIVWNNDQKFEFATLKLLPILIYQIIIPYIKSLFIILELLAQIAR